MADTKKQDLVVTLSGDRKAHEVVKDLKAAGLSGLAVLEAVGVVTGHVTGAGAASKVSRMRKVHGVADVSEEHAPVDIGPPGKSPS